MEREEACVVFTVNMSQGQGQTKLLAMHIVKGLKKGDPTFLETIANVEEENGSQETLLPCIEKLLKEKKMLFMMSYLSTCLLGMRWIIRLSLI